MQTNINPCDEAKLLISKLDATTIEALIATMVCMLRGGSNKRALAACNEVLVANGRKPVTPTCLSQKDGI